MMYNIENLPQTVSRFAIFVGLLKVPAINAHMKRSFVTKQKQLFRKHTII